MKQEQIQHTQNYLPRDDIRQRQKFGRYWSMRGQCCQLFLDLPVDPGFYIQQHDPEIQTKWVW